MQGMQDSSRLWVKELRLINFTLFLSLIDIKTNTYASEGQAGIFEDWVASTTDVWGDLLKYKKMVAW